MVRVLLYFLPNRGFVLCSKWAWSPLDNATPLKFPSAKSLVSEPSVDVSFVSVLAMVLSEY
jgi:hypothetical protein